MRQKLFRALSSPPPPTPLFNWPHRSFSMPRRNTVLLGCSILLMVVVIISYNTVDENLPEDRLVKEVSKVELDTPATTQQPKPKLVEVTAAPPAPVIVKYDPRIGILLIACNRVEVRRAIDSLLQYRPAQGYPIVLSQDCGHGETAKTIDTYEDRLIHLQQPNLQPIENMPPDQKHFEGYYKISRHYKWAMSEMFDVLMFDQIIIVEDDLEIAPDFYEYFEAMLPLLHSDSSLYCVSAWNDNGKIQFINDPATVRRTDFFPGLGWMLTRSLWNELRPKWPAAFWDDWMRHDDQRKGRSCIQPEISRTFTFGERGASGGQYWNEHLRHIVLNNVPVPFLSLNVTRSLTKDVYDPVFLNDVYQKAQVVSVSQVLNLPDTVSGRKLYRVQYNNRKSFESITKQLGLMGDIRAGIPRCAYKGVVEFKKNGHRVFLAPDQDWLGYKFLEE